MPGKGSNSVHLRHYNERVVLEALRRLGQVSKAEVARYAHLTPPAVAAIVAALLEAGYVRESGRRFGGKGQPSALYELDPDGAFSIGLHIGRRALDAILIGFAGQTVAFERFEYDFPAPDNLRQLANSALHRFRAQLGPAKLSRLVGVGVSAPYFIGGWDQELGFPAEVSKAWRALDLTTGYFATGGRPLIVENDASAAAAAELVLGVGTQYQDFLHISLNTFIGAGLVLNGTLQTGPHGNTAAFAPFPVTFSALNSVPHPSGKFEQLLHRASIYTLLNHLRFNGFSVMRVRELELLPPKATPFVAEWQNDAAEAIAQAIAGSIAVVDVEAVVIDGLLPRPLLLDTVARVRTYFSELLPYGLVAPEIMTGALGPRASALGASLLPIYSMFGPDTGVLSKKALDRKPLMVGSLA
jgi:predicted NBD/HSP70 family sugar kinase